MNREGDALPRGYSRAVGSGDGERRQLEAFKERLYAILTLAYSWLFETAEVGGHWKDEVRSTALAGLCLTHREPKGSPWLAGVEAWLKAKQVRMGEKEDRQEKGSWGEQLWDTSMAVIALTKLGLPSNDPVIERALQWQRSLYDLNGHHNWHGEPWETSWTVLSLLDAGDKHRDLEAALRGTHWLVSLQDDSGSIVAPHYTAYFLKIYGKLRLERGCEAKFERPAQRAIDCLVRNIDSERLWTGEAWSNGQILWCLLEVASLEDLGLERLQTIASWFSDNQEKEEGSWFGEVENTASSILGLHRLVRDLELVSLPSRSAADNLVFQALTNKLATPRFPGVQKRWHRDADGTIAIHVLPRDQKVAALIVLVVSTVSLAITFWEQLAHLVAGLLRLFH